MIQDYPEYFWDGQVRYGEVGPDGLAKLADVANWFQETAGINANLLEFGDIELHKRNMAWVLTRMVMRVLRLPAVGDHVRVRTWPAYADRFYHRGYELLAQTGEVLVSSAAEWVLMDMASRRMTPMPDDMQAIYPRKTFGIMPFTCRVLPRLREAQSTMPVLVRRDDRDMNGHVNNTRYVGWILSVLNDLAAPFTLDVCFRAESFPDDMLEVACSSNVRIGEADDALCGYVLSITRDGAEVCRGVCLPG